MNTTRAGITRTSTGAYTNPIRNTGGSAASRFGSNYTNALRRRSMGGAGG